MRFWLLLRELWIGRFIAVTGVHATYSSVGVRKRIAPPFLFEVLECNQASRVPAEEFNAITTLSIAQNIVAIYPPPPLPPEQWLMSRDSQSVLYGPPSL